MLHADRADKELRYGLIAKGARERGSEGARAGQREVCETSSFLPPGKGAMITACILHGGLKGGGETENSNNYSAGTVITWCWH